MGFLEKHDPALYEKYLRRRHLDRRISVVFGDLETVAQIDEAATGSVDCSTNSIVAELIEELRHRIAVCEVGLNQTEE